MASTHIVTAFENELNNLNGRLVAMGQVALSQFERSLQALRDRDAALADSIVAEDSAIDAAQNAVDEAVLAVLVLRHPVADDLRLVLASSKIAAQLERVGDLAANIAKRVKAMASSPEIAMAKEGVAMGAIAGTILTDALAAVADRDASLARRAKGRDVVLDKLYSAFYRDLLKHMMDIPSEVAQCTHLLFIGKNIERVGDHATNIAELAAYLLNGNWPSGSREKADDSSSLGVSD